MSKKNQKTAEQPTNERRAEFAQRMQIMKAWNGSFHVLEVAGGGGEPIKAWPGPFRLKRAAELLLEDMVEAYVDNTLGTACCPLALERPNFVADYEREGIFVALLEEQGGVDDPRGLARLLLQKQPWCGRGGFDDGGIPF
jgi:hypothetical protein